MAGKWDIRLLGKVELGDGSLAPTHNRRARHRIYGFIVVGSTAVNRAVGLNVLAYDVGFRRNCSLEPAESGLFLCPANDDVG